MNSANARRCTVCSCVLASYHLKTDKMCSPCQEKAEREAERRYASGGLRWAKNWDCCRECGTLVRKHRTRGLCDTCLTREKQGYAGGRRGVDDCLGGYLCDCEDRESNPSESGQEPIRCLRVDGQKPNLVVYD